MLVPMRHVIHSASGPGVTTQDAPRAQRRSANHAILLDRLESVSGARRVIAADISVQGGDDGAVSAKKYYRAVAWQEQQKARCSRHCHCLGHRPVLRSSPVKISLCRVVHETPGDPGSARIIRSVPVGRDSTTSCPIARSRRVTRLRVTALPTLLETMKPTRVTSLCSRRAM
jgi:hypothetical protein